MTANRRTFLKSTAGTLLATSLAGTARAAGQAKPSIRLGAPLFNAPKDPEALALAYRKLGYRAAYCPGVKLDDRQRIADIARAFAKHDVVLAEVGRWCNLMDPDPAKRATNLKTVTEGLALAEAIGARCCVDIAGSFNPQVWHGQHPENLSRKFFDLAVENARKVIDAVKPKRAKFCYEMMPWALPDSADSYVEMIKAVGRDAFGVHLDPCNLLNSPWRVYHNTEVLNECFDKLAPWIASCHAKDIAWDKGVQVSIKEVPIGEGLLDYRTYLRRLAAVPHQPPLMIEHMHGAEEYDRCRQQLMKVAPTVGVSFEA
jgi:sugar phosphate isomerase/epimerase